MLLYRGLIRNTFQFLCAQGLAETKLEMRRKEQTSRQLNKQIAQLEADKKAQQNNIKDAEKALRTVAK